MAVDQVLGRPWTRKHDDPAVPVRASAPRTVFPKSLKECIELCATRSPGEQLTAAGSHWALSTAAIADTIFVETHDRDELFQAMGRTLFEVVPGCLNDKVLSVLADSRPPAYDEHQFHENGGFYLVHFETGKRVYQLYAELDTGDDNNPDSLAVVLRDRFHNPHYLGPWAFPTLGGAGGQTVFGALTTGTHGGDFRLPPIADAVMALHLVADGGRHYWIEPNVSALDVPLTDDAKLLTLYGDDRLRGNRATGAENFEIIRDDDVFNAVLIGAGRFGIVYSVVARAVRQYTLHEQRRLSTWQAVRGQIGDATSTLFNQKLPTAPDGSPIGPGGDNRFLQVAVCLTPHANFTRNLVGVTKRWNAPMKLDPTTGVPSGRAERVGAIIEPFNAAIQAPLFEHAGRSHAYSPDTLHPGSAADPSFLERACSNADFLQGVLQVVIEEVEDFITSNGAVIGATIAGIVAAGGGAFLLALLPALLIILAILAAFAAALATSPDTRLGQSLNDLKDSLLNRSDPDERAAGLFVWQLIAFRLFSDQQSDRDYDAISYAVMDGHDYFDRSCNVNVDSIEVFFRADDPMLLAYVDALIAFETAQETRALAFVGYASLRFTGATRALIGEERHPLNCVVEVAGLRDVTGTQELIDFATRLALDPNFAGILHWGQRNDSNRDHIEARFGDAANSPGGDLGSWRDGLSRITGHGSLDGFSNSFTRQTGLEIVTPRAGPVSVVGATPTLGQPFAVTWNFQENPPTTRLSLRVVSPSGVVMPAAATVPLAGQTQVHASETGSYTITLKATISLGGQTRTAAQTLTVTV